jgi:hypothetical protein
MERYFHVTSVRNRDSIQARGLDWERMGAARGIAGSVRPEQDGCFVCLSEWEMEWFVDMNNTGGPVDVWEVEGVNESELVESPEGHSFVPRRIPADCLRLHQTDVPQRER